MPLLSHTVQGVDLITVSLFCLCRRAHRNARAQTDDHPKDGCLSLRDPRDCVLTFTRRDEDAAASTRQQRPSGARVLLDMVLVSNPSLGALKSPCTNKKPNNSQNKTNPSLDERLRVACYVKFGSACLPSRCLNMDTPQTCFFTPCSPFNILSTTSFWIATGNVFSGTTVCTDEEPHVGAKRQRGRQERGLDEDSDEDEERMMPSRIMTRMAINYEERGNANAARM